jgi:peptidoglycan hydrolase-like protein with peptidoglycan-binding domain
MAAIYLSIGHGVRPNGTFDPGACSTTTSETEYDGNRDLCFHVAAGLRAAGHDVESESDMAPRTDPDYQGSVDLANGAPRALSLDLHMDWEQGSTALCWPLIHPGSAEGTRIAQEVINACQAMNLSTKGPTPREDLWWLNGTNAPAVLIEAGRVGSPRPVADLAAGIVNGICLALGGTSLGADDTHPQPPVGGAPPGDATVSPPGEHPPWPGIYLIAVTSDPSARTWQAQMQKRGWVIDVDGIYGGQSAEVCMQFQLEKALSDVDGVVGPETWQASFSLPVD